MLTQRQVASYTELGYLVLESMIDGAELELLRSSALETIDEFNFLQQGSVFSAREGEEMREDYFFDSAEKFRMRINRALSFGPFQIPFGHLSIKGLVVMECDAFTQIECVDFAIR